MLIGFDFMYYNMYHTVAYILMIELYALLVVLLLYCCLTQKASTIVKPLILIVIIRNLGYCRILILRNNVTLARKTTL